MQTKTDTDIRSLHEHFCSSLTYEEKLQFFEEHLQLVPFEFPSVDLEITWYQSENKLRQLKAIFDRDSYKSKVYQKELRYQGNTYVFDINPLKASERTVLNKFILLKFAGQIENVKAKAAEEINNSIDPIFYLEDRMKHTAEKIAWVHRQVQESMDNSSLKDRFLAVLARGIREYQLGEEDILKIRRKFIELYLYSEGQLLAQYLDHLKTLLHQYKTNSTLSGTFTLPQKLILFHRLGLIDYLKTKMKKEGKQNVDQHVANLFCLITGTDIKQQELVYLLTAFMGTGEHHDLLESYNHQLIEELLQQYD